MTGGATQPRLAVLVDNDEVWGLPVWAATLPALICAGYEVAGIWICPARLGRRVGADVPRWYLRHFGALDFCKLAAIAVVRLICNRLAATSGASASSFDRLGERHQIPVRHIASPNDETFKIWLAKEKIDILIIMVSHILKPDVLALPRLGTVNKHAALLPANRGIFPYFWAAKKTSRKASATTLWRLKSTRAAC